MLGLGAAQRARVGKEKRAVSQTAVHRFGTNINHDLNRISIHQKRTDSLEKENEPKKRYRTESL